MKKRLLSLVLSAVMAVSAVSFAAVTSDATAVETFAAASIPAFPGAEGGGKYATGGRGGTVYHVTNLNDSGTGSFRDAVSSSNRIVVFDIGGTIELKSDVVVKSNITIAGQTAPGGHGVTLKNYKVGLGGSNIIMRYISSRPGERGSSAEYDALGGSDGSNSIIDHCAFGWANDEQWGLYSNNDMYTTQWTIIGPANSFSYHSKGIHGFGIMFGKSNTTWHHNLVVHNISRNFRGKVEGTSTAEFVNNVIYDWGYQTAYGTLGHLNYVNNYLKKGEYTTGIRYINKSSGSNYEKMKFYLTGNKIVEKDGTVLVAEGEDWAKGSNGFDEATYGSQTPFAITYNSENIAYATHAETADEAYANVTSFVGPAVNAESRTEIDAEVISDTINGTGTLSGARPLSEASSTQKAEIEKYGITCGVTYNYPKTTYASDYGDLYTDTDGDGMPDWWELERGLDPYNASSAEINGDYCGKGYTNIEYYLNDLTVDSFPEGTVETSPKVSSEVTVDATANGSDPSVVKTIAEAMQYIEEAEAEGVSGAKTVYIANGTYNEDLVINIDNVIVQPAEGASSITVNNILVNGKSDSVSGINGKTITVSGDEAVFSNVSGTSVVLGADTRSYFNGCNISGSITGTNAQSVFENSTITASGVIANVTAKAATAYAVEFKDCTLSGTSVASGSGIAAVYGGTANIGGTWFSGVTGVVSGVSGDSSATVLSETDFLNAYYGPYNFTKGLYGKTADGWNPGGWDTITPQESLAALADSITLSSVISRDTAVVTSFESDPDVKVSWTSSNSDRFKNNVITTGEYGEGAVTVTLTATLSKTGLSDEVRTFTVTVGSSSVNTDGVVTFNECAVGDVPSYFMDDSSATDDSIEGYVTDNIDGIKFADHDKFYVINQSGTTDPNIHNFNWVFTDEGLKDAVYETSYDVYLTDISTDGYCEAYVRGSSTLGQVRFVENGGDYSIMSYERIDGKSVGTELVTAGSAWYTVKMVVDASGISSGTEPVVNYYLYSDDGSLISSVKNCSPSAAYTAAEYEKFLANRLQFRPRRTDSQVKFYVDNLSYTNLTDLAEEDAAAISENSTLVMKSGDSLPVYGNHMTNITWSAVDGTSGIVNSDGTINYSAFSTATVKVKGVVTAGDELVGTAETSVITLSLTGTGSGTVTPADPSFESTDDFSDWNIQKDQTSVVDKADAASVGGNSSTKIRLDNKAVFKVLDGNVGTGTAVFTADIYKTGVDASTGRAFRIYFENAETAAANGVGTEEFATTNIIYHLMDVGNEVYSVISDAPSANSAVDTDLGINLSDDAWYRIVVSLDIDNKTATTSIYSHSDNGSYNPDAAFDTPLVTETTSLISKSPMQLKQIRLVRTASGTVYFDNVSLEVNAENITDNPDDPDNPDNPDNPDDPVTDDYDVNGDGNVDMNDANEILQYTLNKFAVSDSFDESKADINGDGAITALDASILAQYILDKQ